MNVDCIVFAQQPKLSPYKEAIRRRIAELLAASTSMRRREGQDRRKVGPVGAGARSRSRMARRRAWLGCACIATKSTIEPQSGIATRLCRFRSSLIHERIPIAKPCQPATPHPHDPRLQHAVARPRSRSSRSQPGKVGIYLCGPTVYKPSHIGHMVGPVIFDAIKRYLAY